MQARKLHEQSYAMPYYSPSYPRGPYRYAGREHLTITYRSVFDAVRRVVPEPLIVDEPLVQVEFVHVADSTGFGAYFGAAQLIPVRLGNEKGAYTRLMFLDSHPPIAGGRELWGFPQKLGGASLTVEHDHLVGVLDFGPARVALGTMGYKHVGVPARFAAAAVESPGFLLKIIPHVDGTPRICELVRYRRRDIQIEGAWTGPVSLDLRPHALAPLCDLPVTAIVSGIHYIADFTLELGEVAYDYRVNAAPNKTLSLD